LEWLNSRGHHLPDGAATEIPVARARPDFVYHLPGADVAVFVDGAAAHGAPAPGDADGRDRAAEQRLMMRGWLVIRFTAVPDADTVPDPETNESWELIVRRYPTVFGAGRTAR
jgi:hypothetical protein